MLTCSSAVIQGTADATSKLSQAEFSKTIDFLTRAFSPALNPQFTDANQEIVNGEPKPQMSTEGLSPEDLEALQNLRLHHGKHTMGMESFTTDVVDGMVPRLETGRLTLIPAEG